MSLTSGTQRAGKHCFVYFALCSLKKEGNQLELHVSKHFLDSESFKLDTRVMFTNLYELNARQSKNVQ